jgi:hypothetical protein
MPSANGVIAGSHVAVSLRPGQKASNVILKTLHPDEHALSRHSCAPAYPATGTLLGAL